MVINLVADGRSVKFFKRQIAKTKWDLYLKTAANKA